MTAILGMKQRTKWRAIRATKDDLEAVQQLPDLEAEAAPAAAAAAQ